MEMTWQTDEAFTLVGWMVRTSVEDELDLARAKVGAMVGRYFAEHVAVGIDHRREPGVTYSVYTDFDEQDLGMYTHFIGESVASEEQSNQDLHMVKIPAQNYARFALGTAATPHMCDQVWQSIRTMGADDLGGRRAFVADFERYDGQEKGTLDIFLGLEVATV